MARRGSPFGMPMVATRHNSDLQVRQVSDALAKRTLDVIVSGSIAAVESVRLIRALRRLGATVSPWLTTGGAQFVTPMALSWAAAQPTRERFEGDASHIALGDACVVAPASAALIAKAALGITDTPAAALIASYLGCGKPLLLLPSMHDSLAMAPAVRRNLERLREDGALLLASRLEEGKHKFPDPEIVADEVAHALNRAKVGHKPVLVTMGTTRGYMDEVRYLSNYSSGRLGSLVVEELHRQGYAAHVVCGPCEIRPRTRTSLADVRTNEEMSVAAERILHQGADAAVLAASVLDFVPTAPLRGKLRSAEHETLHLELKRTRKLIADINPRRGAKVGFKLEVGLTRATATSLSQAYMQQYALSMMVLNDLHDVDASRHSALVREQDSNEVQAIEGKEELARAIVRHIDARLRMTEPST